METFAEKLPVPASLTSILHFPELLSEEGLISYVLPVFCLHFFSSASPQRYSGACLLNSNNSCNIFNSYPLPASLSLLHGFPKVPDA